jgi:hypothetical protein
VSLLGAIAPLWRAARAVAGRVARAGGQYGRYDGGQRKDVRRRTVRGTGRGAARIPWRSRRACHLGTGRVRWEGAGRRGERGTAEGGHGRRRRRGARAHGARRRARVPLFERVKLQKVE